MKLVGKNNVAVTVQVKARGQKSKSLTLVDTNVEEVFEFVNETFIEKCNESDGVTKNEKAI